MNTCPNCNGGWLCNSCQQEKLRLERNRSLAMACTASARRQQQINRIIVWFEPADDLSIEEQAINITDHNQMSEKDTTHTIRGPRGLTIELDRDQVFPDDPGQGTPAMVYRNKGLCDEASGSYWCVTQTSEFINTSGDADPILSQEDIDWLDSKLEEVEKFLDQPKD